jgi:hypothetical protein
VTIAVNVTHPPVNPSGNALIQVTVTPPVNLQPAMPPNPSSFHLHYFIDQQPTPAGGTVPFGNPRIVHTNQTSLEVTGLAAGSHAVTVVLGQYNHTACSARGSATFNIAAVQAPQPPRTGSAGMVSSGGSDDAYAAFALLAVATMLTLSARLATRRAD